MALDTCTLWQNNFSMTEGKVTSSHHIFNPLKEDHSVYIISYYVLTVRNRCIYKDLHTSVLPQLKHSICVHCTTDEHDSFEYWHLAFWRFHVCFDILNFNFWYWQSTLNSLLNKINITIIFILKCFPDFSIWNLPHKYTALHLMSS